MMVSREFPSSRLFTNKYEGFVLLRAASAWRISMMAAAANLPIETSGGRNAPLLRKH